MTRVLIIGGGVAGPVTAMALQRAGIDALHAISVDTPVLAAGFPTPSRRFTRYWLVVGPFSALTRRRVLAVQRATVARVASPGADAGRLSDGVADLVPTGELHPPAPGSAVKGQPNP
jgi:hypothetical protein